MAGEARELARIGLHQPAGATARGQAQRARFGLADAAVHRAGTEGQGLPARLPCRAGARSRSSRRTLSWRMPGGRTGKSSTRPSGSRRGACQWRPHPARRSLSSVRCQVALSRTGARASSSSSPRSGMAAKRVSCCGRSRNWHGGALRYWPVGWCATRPPDQTIAALLVHATNDNPAARTIPKVVDDRMRSPLDQLPTRRLSRRLGIELADCATFSPVGRASPCIQHSGPLCRDGTPA